MGIQDLTKSIKKHAPGAIAVLEPANIPGSVYGVDVFSYLYPAKYNPGAKGKGQHIRFFYDLITNWRKAGKTLIMVFDGNTSEVSAKSDTVMKRQDARRQKQDIIDEITTRIEKGATISDQDKVDLERATRNTIKITETDIDDLKKLFGYMSVSYCQAKGEADCALAAMYSTGDIHGVISEDSDMLTHGIGFVVRGLIDAKNRSAGVVNLYNLSEILAGFDMTMKQFIDFCILSGCDYCPRVPGVGPVGAFKHIKTGGSPSTLHTDPSQYVEAYRMFTDHKDAIEFLTLTPEAPQDIEFKIWLTSNTTRKGT